MTAIAYLIPIALLLGGAGLAAFLWAVRSGQYDDLDGAAQRVLIDEDRPSLPKGNDRSSATDAIGD